METTIVHLLLKRKEENEKLIKGLRKIFEESNNIESEEIKNKIKLIIKNIVPDYEYNNWVNK